MHKGTVIKSTGNWYQVRLEDDSVIRCRIVGKFRLEGKKLTNPVAVGDEVQIKIEAADETGIIQTILDRKNYVARQSPRKKHHIHLLASNVDQAIVIATIVAPKLKQGFIDRFLLMTEPYRIPTTIVFNKSDVYQAADMELYDYLKQMYEAIGYQVLLTSAFSGEGLEQLKHTLKDQQTLLSGQSGVGKSSLVNAIQPQLELRTGEISDFSGKGQHTTTFAEMYPLDFGGT
ncbi:MAG: ribosome small subunit-dependent GTPase A, partial [Bacteroidota bacterium]